MRKLREAYNNVFDSNGNIKVCGRDKCKDLILELQKQYPGVDFGNSKTGMMKVGTIKNYMGTE